MAYEILIGFVLATAVLAVAPGPDNIYVLTQSLVNGKKYGLATIVGLISGCLVHTTLLAFGVAAIIKQHDSLFFALKLFGAFYLFFLAYKVYKNSETIELKSNRLPKKRPIELVVQGFFMNVLNPKVTIFFLAFFPSFLFSATMNTVIQFYILGFVFMLVSAVIFSAIAILAANVSNIVKENSRMGYWLKWLQIYVFIAIGVYIVMSDI